MAEDVDAIADAVADFLKEELDRRFGELPPPAQAPTPVVNVPAASVLVEPVINVPAANVTIEPVINVQPAVPQVHVTNEAAPQFDVHVGEEVAAALLQNGKQVSDAMQSVIKAVAVAVAKETEAGNKQRQDALIDAFKSLTDAVTAPRSLVLDGDGKPVGVVVKK